MPSEYEIHVCPVTPPVDISLTHQTVQQKQKLSDIRRRVLEGSERSQRISPDDYFVDITTMAMKNKGEKAGVIAYDNGTGTVTFVRRLPFLDRFFNYIIFGKNGMGDGLKTESFQLSSNGSDRVLVGCFYDEYRRMVSKDDIPQRIGRGITVEAIVFRLWRPHVSL